MSHFDGSNVTVLNIIKNQKIYLLSDLHWDNPHCELGYLKKTLDKAKKENAKVIINGDFFCLMQGKGDRRGSKSDIREEHNKGIYFDAVVNTAVEWFKPYAHLIEMIGYGNHETSVLRYHETDILERFITLLNYATGANVQRGGYGGWVALRIHDSEEGKHRSTFTINYHHGWGGGGPVTHGVIQHARKQTVVENADCIWLGHTHSCYILSSGSERFLSYNNGYKVKKSVIWNLRTPSFKEEHTLDHKGFQGQNNNSNKVIGYVELFFTGTHRIGYDANFTPVVYKTY